jgi:hypothetical protein
MQTQIDEICRDILNHRPLPRALRYHHSDIVPA